MYKTLYTVKFVWLYIIGSGPMNVRIMGLNVSHLLIFSQISEVFEILGILSQSPLFVNIYTWRQTHDRISKMESVEMSGVEI